jgi:hypothetical protein
MQVHHGGAGMHVSTAAAYLPKTAPRTTQCVAWGLIAALLLGAVGCVDLDVPNLNEPDGDRALATSDDLEAFLGGAYQRWFGVHYYVGPTMFLSVTAGEHSAPWACCGMEMYARIPRTATQNVAGAPNVGTLTFAWYRSYQAIATVREALTRLANGTVDLGTDGNLRARAYGRFVLGLAHGTIALLYDSGFVYDETVDREASVLQDYETVMGAALGYLADAAALASQGSFTIPAAWLSQDVSAPTLAQLAHSWRARFRANVARTPAERAAVDWDAVVSDVSAGITEDWDNHSQCSENAFCDEALIYRLYYYWQMQNNWIAGMADQSGRYQVWINTPTIDKMPFLIVTPDTRWPQGPDEATQLANPGSLYAVNEGPSRIWSRPDRGTWKWSYYGQRNEPFFSAAHSGQDDPLPMVTLREMKALIAESQYRAGNLAAVASFVNETRTLHGLTATDAQGANADCVPRLPSGACGDLWEMFKWEKRLETQFAGPLRLGWYFDGRGWGDLIEGTILQFPVPYGEMEILGQPPYDLGGVGGLWGAPIGTYGY